MTDYLAALQLYWRGMDLQNNTNFNKIFISHVHKWAPWVLQKIGNDSIRFDRMEKIETVSSNNVFFSKSLYLRIKASN